MCMQSSVNATFENVAFHNCSLLVLQGAQATPSRPEFTLRSAPGLLVHGESSRLTVD